MDRNTLIRWAVIAVIMGVFWKFVLPKLTGGEAKPQNIPEEVYVNAPDFAKDVLDPTTKDDPHAATPKAPEETCKIAGPRFDAILSTRGAALTHFYLRDAQYAGVSGFDMSTTPDHERWRSLRTLFRGEGANDAVKFDRFNWRLNRLPNDSGCEFTYDDELVRIRKTVTKGERPFELSVNTEITNLAKDPKKHQFQIGAYAFRRNKEIKGNLGRVSPFQTDLACAAGKEVTRKPKDAFKEGWFNEQHVDRFAAVNNYYFSQALMPQNGDAPSCALLAEEWVSAGQTPDSDEAGAVYHAKLVYPARTLEPNATATYTQLAFFGPKERDVLAKAGGGTPGLGDVIDLGFFSPVAKVLVGVLVAFHKALGNWGLSIILMTVCLKIALLPLTWKSIKSMVGMRKLKPEIDDINRKFADDPQAKNLATLELWRKHGVNPISGCLPQLIQMPVWFAMYTTLQTAVEMYHEKFLWFQDLSAPDRFYVLPLVLGAFMIVQQKIVPQQPGMDPMQQKMMMYIMPIMFTVMMLFLPAALGVYMLTNSVLGIVQQLVVEQIAPRDGDGGGSPNKREIVVKEVSSV